MTAHATERFDLAFAAWEGEIKQDGFWRGLETVRLPAQKPCKAEDSGHALILLD
jgi:hypothetical protein